MRFFLLLLVSLLASAPAALAHMPPGPVLNCQNTYLAGNTSGHYHDYLPPAMGGSVSPDDGNLANCDKPDPVEFGILNPNGEPCAMLTANNANPGPPVCGSATLLSNQPFLDYDGELDHAFGGATLFVRTGDGVTDGVTACYGWPSVGHHTASIYVEDAFLGPVAFSVVADFSRPGLEETPDCGDLVIEPCVPNPPPPSGMPFPVNLLVDTINGVTYTLFGPGGSGCNELDQAYSCPTTGWPPSGSGPNRCTVPFGDGADGSYGVLVGRAGAPATAGHVWTPSF